MALSFPKFLEKETYFTLSSVSAHSLIMERVRSFEPSLMNMYSKLLSELDKNTVVYMIDELKAEIDSQKAELDKKDAELGKKDAELDKKDAEIERLKKLLKEKQ